jgi:hypothetical protein
MLEGATLVILAAFSPWALLKLLPLHELSAGLEGMGARLQQPLAEASRPAGALNDAAGDLVHRLISGEREWVAAQPRGAGESVAQLARGSTGEHDRARAAAAGDQVVSADEPTPGADEPTPAVGEPTPGADEPTPASEEPWKPPPDTGTIQITPETLASGQLVADEAASRPRDFDTDE